MAVDRHPSAALVDQRADDTDRGRLARAVGTEQREEIAFGDAQADALQGLEAVAVSLVEIVDLEGGGHAVPGVGWRM
jgi:hypothetical protein